MNPNDQTPLSTNSPTSHPEPLVVPLTILTVVSGLIDAISYLGLGHVFTANMTGNVVILGFAAAGAPGFSVAGSLVSLAAFLTGALASGRLSLAMRERSCKRWIGVTLASEVVLLGTAAAIAFATRSAPYAVIAVTALAMGLRNGTVRKLAVPDVTTTVLTLTLTGLAADSSLAGGTNPRAGRRLSAVAAMLAGALLGGWLVLQHGLGWPLLMATASAAAAAAAALVLRRMPA